MCTYINNQSSSDMVYRLASPAFKAVISNDPGRTGFDSRYRNHDHWTYLFCLVRLLWDVFCFSQGPISFLQQRRWKSFLYLLLLHTYRYLVLGTTYYIKSDKVDEEHGYIGGTYIPHLSALLATATVYLTIGMTEPRP